MTTPPVCNYEGSDYQSVFWDKGERAYEDAVEEVALRRLLPKHGKLLLELGAGAGRNTPRYPMYERIVLLDYSRTQLEQARKRLGDSDRYVYVAADIYRMPFVSGRFDGATMIRTLHHMADAPAALKEVRRVMEPAGTFILEFANKQNIKAMARYALKKQPWSPYTLDPVEYVDLNFDFHPKAVRNWLAEHHFEVQRQLTVSHYRFPLFKKLIPHKLLVAMDSLAQYSGNWWQLSPSVFVLTHGDQSGEKAVDENLFACPNCGHAPLPESKTDVTCPQCGKTYPFADGIYDFRLNPES
ncbi:MAG TPA: methyltransferase domain-containing protein [Bellilinea sp.]|nr:methyltransferase domain-containing protein [Bellilinea sp.]